MEQLAFTDIPRGRRITRADQIFDRFRAFHLANPRVWELFQRFTSELLHAGYAHYSADAVLHRIRWHIAVEIRGGDGVKINNDFSAYYGRMWMAANPEAPPLFRTRHRKSTDRAAYAADLPVCDTGPPEGGDAELMAALEQLARHEPCLPPT